MNFKYSLVLVALVNAGVVQANGFKLSKDKVADVDKSAWACRRCKSQDTRGVVGASAVVTDSDNRFSANRFGESSDFAGAVQADLVHRLSSGARVEAVADDLGLDTGYGTLRYIDGFGEVSLGYQSNLRVDADGALTQYGYDGANLVVLDETVSRDLVKKRESWLFGAKLSGDFWKAFADYEHQSKTGQKSGSVLINNGPVNIVEPIEHTTDKLKAGVELQGERWLTRLRYEGSLFQNENSALNDARLESVYAFEPDNDAHLVALDSAYRWDKTVLFGRVASGWMFQNQSYVDSAGVPPGITHLNGEVQTTSVDLKLTSSISSSLRLNAAYRYQDKDNKTPVQSFGTVDYDPDSGVATSNTPLDTTRTQYELSGSYRWNRFLRFNAGYEFDELEQSDVVRETVDEDKVFLKVKLVPSPQWKLSLSGQLESRGGSDYQASSATSSEDNPLLRKYHLADRDRTEVEAKLAYYPMPSISIDVGYRLADDDYSASELGVTESKDQSYDISIAFLPTEDIDLYVFGGRQLIESAQQGSQSFGVADWTGSVDDEFYNIGFGGVIHHLYQDKITVGLDYQYSDSSSDSNITGQSEFGDYIAWSHDVNLYAEYQVNPKLEIRADYNYERYYSADYADVSVDYIPGLVTLGEMNTDYNAHQIKLSINYKF